MKPRPTYLHPLDYPLGLKYYLTEERVPCNYSVSPETFLVEEIVDWDGLGFNEEKGEYVVLRVWKRDFETLSAVRIIARRLGVPAGNILFFGLKDRTATAIQYFFVKRSLFWVGFRGLTSLKLSVRIHGYVARKPNRGFLRGNLFTLRVKDCTGIDAARGIMGLIEGEGLPSYYGYQRFGARRPNTHLLGYYLLSGRMDLFLEEFAWRPYPSEPPGILLGRLTRRLDRLPLYERLAVSDGTDVFLQYFPRLRTLFIDAYQSYLYNLLLNHVIGDEGWGGLDRDYPMPGCDIGLYERVLNVNIPSGEKMACWSRHGLFRPLSWDVEKRGESLMVRFMLGSGFYASVVMRELFKDKLFFD